MAGFEDAAVEVEKIELDRADIAVSKFGGTWACFAAAALAAALVLAAASMAAAVLSVLRCFALSIWRLVNWSPMSE